MLQDINKTHVLSRRVTLEPTGAQRKLLGFTCDEYHLTDVLLAVVFASCSVAEKISNFVQENLQETASFPIGLTVFPSSTASRSRCVSPNSRPKPPRRGSLTFPPPTLLIHVFYSVWFSV